MGRIHKHARQYFLFELKAGSKVKAAEFDKIDRWCHLPFEEVEIIELDGASEWVLRVLQLL